MLSWTEAGQLIKWGQRLIFVQFQSKLSNAFLNVVPMTAKLRLTESFDKQTLNAMTKIKVAILDVIVKC